ncbi:hypothetical protein GCM10017674_30810 [Streptomyces gardneri]|uniref:Uncharacterized protein n=1 Tax=Streptomyces gardneri TaxID=66892 RepID=A0A4Y3RE51_9ACTN|nr:hypothetical protein SGA01_05920 [Streptomyces gardneri]GHG97603.1 hypothetical protein GCM10017674_30810 [Streptomyces gardneri]
MRILSALMPSDLGSYRYGRTRKAFGSKGRSCGYRRRAREKVGRTCGYSSPVSHLSRENVRLRQSPEGAPLRDTDADSTGREFVRRLRMLQHHSPRGRRQPP